MTALREAARPATACNFVEVPHQVMPQQRQLVICNDDASGAAYKMIHQQRQLVVCNDDASGAASGDASTATACNL